MEEKAWCGNCGMMMRPEKGFCVACQDQIWPPKNSGVILRKPQETAPTTEETGQQ